jgi:methanogenic corrinoid protein MtbC1
MEAEILKTLKKAVLEYDAAAAERLAKRAMEEGIDPLDALAAMTEAIKEVGEGFGRGDLWLPDLTGAATAMERALPVVEEAIKSSGKARDSLGVVVIGTVFGDIHTIGKGMVGTMLTAEGFEVHDLGINVSAETFVAAVKEYKPDILAMSALLTTTAPEAMKVIDALKEEGVRDKFKVMVGGGAITEGFAKTIGADGYDPTAPGAVDVAKTLLNISQ